MATEHEPAPVKSAERTLKVIDLLAGARDGLSFTEIQTVTGWPRSSTYNLLRTLTSTGHLEFDEADHLYRIGLRLWEAGQAYVRTHDLGRTARRYLESASKSLDETVQLAVRDGQDVVYIAKVEAHHALQLVSDIGSRLPAHATGLGKALLAWCDPEEVELLYDGVDLAALTAQTITDKRMLMRELRATRERGYAIDLGEITDGIYCIATPVFGHDGSIVAAMSTSVPEPRVDDSKRARMVTVLTEQAQQLSAAFGNGSTDEYLASRIV